MENETALADAINFRSAYIPPENLRVIHWVVKALMQTNPELVSKAREIGQTELTASHAAHARPLIEASLAVLDALPGGLKDRGEAEPPTG